MNKKDICDIVADESEYSREDVNKIVTLFIDKLKDRIIFGYNVRIQGFITFSIRIKNAYTTADPRDTSRRVDIPRRYNVHGSIAKSLKDSVRKKPVR
jgi:nucleoid DNA-binding protein